MFRIKIYILFILLFACYSSIAQDDIDMEIDPMPIRLKGKIISAGDKMPIPYAHIVNSRTHGGTTSNSGGFFSIEMLNVDSLIISVMGFSKKVVVIPYNYNQIDIHTITLNPVSIALREINVEGEKAKVNMDGIPVGDPVDIAPELRGDAFNERPPIVAALFNPVSFWYYHLSKKEKRKRKVREAMAIEKNWEMHSRNYNKKVVMLLTEMNDKQADDFMVWFNSQNILPYTSTEYEVRASIREYFEIYKLEGRLK